MRYSPASVRTPDEFKKMNAQSTEYHSLMWSFVFYINLALTFLVFYYVVNQTVGFKIGLQMISKDFSDLTEFKNEYPEFNNSEFYITLKNVKQSLKIAIGATLISNLLHLIYLIVFPSFYIQLHLITTLILSFVPAILLFLPQTSSFVQGNYSIWGIIGALFSVGLGIFSYTYRKKYVKTSASILKTSAQLLKKHPSLLLVQIIQSFLLLVLNIMFTLSATVIRSFPDVNFNPLVYVYGVFTYYWIIMTIYYTCYMITAGVIGYEFYLGDSQSKPKNLVLFSFKRAMTQQFGCAALAGFILAIIQTLKFLLEFLSPENRRNRKKKKNSDEDEDEKENFATKILLNILYYTLSCILSLAESFFSFMSRQALIYCAIFGCSYKEGCNRFHSKGIMDRINKLQHESIISGALGTNYLLFMIITGAFVSFTQSKLSSDSSLVFLSVFLTEILMLTFFTFVNSLITTSSDTLFLCFLENPSALNNKYNDIYQNLQKVKYE